ENVERFTAEMKKLGRPCELVGYDGESHGFFNYGRPAYPDTIKRMDAFLTTLGYLSK
ncbi:alpha/beta hydrolase, partial [bacterium]|nr:alpha/beta hydrolase [bacterium]